MSEKQKAWYDCGTIGQLALYLAIFFAMVLGYRVGVKAGRIQGETTGFNKGYEQGKGAMQDKAITYGAAYWVVNPKNGEVTLKWRAWPESQVAHKQGR